MDPPDAEQTSGFLVVQLPSVALLAYEVQLAAGDHEGNYFGYVKSLWEALPRVAPEMYRGIARGVLRRYEEGEDQDRGVGPEREARVMLLERLGPDPNEEYALEFHDPDLLPDLAFAREVIAATETPSDWEVIRVARETTKGTPVTLGFDVGYWGSDHFSLIGDTMFMPRWHPAPPEDFEELRAQSEGLNAAALFDTSDAAHRFRDWYLTKSWAEEEGYPAKFQVIRVDEVS